MLDELVGCWMGWIDVSQVGGMWVGWRDVGGLVGC